jgi:tripartite-type tricarboxylate transporter receptor subunit TctC
MGEQFKLATGTDIIHVPYRGVGPALNDAVGGQIQILFDNLPTSLPMIQDSKLRALAVSSPKRRRCRSRIRRAPAWWRSAPPSLRWASTSRTWAGSGGPS